MKVELKQVTKDPESAIANAARISHMASGAGLEGDRRLIRDLISWSHMSPLEFADATFLVRGVSRSCLAQITRHRHASFMVRSMRYVKQEKGEVVIPPSIKKSEVRDLYKERVSSSFATYQELVEAGVPKEDARFALPIGVETQFYIKANFREYRHIIKLRATDEAQWEIRELAERFAEELIEVAPSVFEDLIS
ncbi:MAG: FAD-dependent thymidylate synthase [Candidatus Acetothermia bacterium]